VDDFPSSAGASSVEEEALQLSESQAMELVRILENLEKSKANSKKFKQMIAC